MIPDITATLAYLSLSISHSILSFSLISLFLMLLLSLTCPFYCVLTGEQPVGSVRESAWQVPGAVNGHWGGLRQHDHDPRAVQEACHRQLEWNRPATIPCQSWPSTFSLVVTNLTILQFSQHLIIREWPTLSDGEGVCSAYINGRPFVTCWFGMWIKDCTYSIYWDRWLPKGRRLLKWSWDVEKMTISQKKWRRENLESYSTNFFFMASHLGSADLEKNNQKITRSNSEKFKDTCLIW